MKKVALLLGLVCVIIFTAACGAPVLYNRISFTDFFSGITCDIPMETIYSSWPFQYLHTDISFDELQLRLEEQSGEAGSLMVDNLSENALLLTFFSENQPVITLLCETE